MGEPMLGFRPQAPDAFARAVTRTFEQRYLPTRALPPLPGLRPLANPDRKSDVQTLRDELAQQTRSLQVQRASDDDSDPEVEAQLRRSASESATKPVSEPKAVVPLQKGVFGNDGDFDLEEAAELDASDYRTLRDALKPALLKSERKRELLESAHHSLSQAVTYCKNAGKKQREHHSKVLRTLNSLTRRYTKVVAVKRRRSTMARDIYCVIRARLEEERRLKKELAFRKARVQALRRKVGETKATAGTGVVKKEASDSQVDSNEDAQAEKSLREQWYRVEDDLRKLLDGSADLTSVHPVTLKEDAKSPERKRPRRRRKAEATDVDSGEFDAEAFPDDAEAPTQPVPRNGKTKRKPRGEQANRMITIGTSAKRAVSFDMGLPQIISPLSLAADRAAAAVVWGNQDGIRLQVYPGCAPTGGVALNAEKARARAWRTIAHDVRKQRRAEEHTLVKILDRLNRERKRWNAFVDQAQVLRACAPEASTTNAEAYSEKLDERSEKDSSGEVSALEALSQVSASAATLETSSDVSETFGNPSGKGKAKGERGTSVNPKPIVDQSWEPPDSSESEWGELSRADSDTLTRSSSTASRNGPSSSRGRSQDRPDDKDSQEQDSASLDSQGQVQKPTQKRKMKRRRRMG